MKTIVLNGIGWDTENLAIEGKEHFMYKEALQIANDSGKRLPTKKEFEKLFQLQHEWDDDEKGMWFAERATDLKSAKSLFLPASGYGTDGSTSMHYVGMIGNYWSATSNNTCDAYYLGFSDKYENVYNYYRYGCFSVRCVSE